MTVAAPACRPASRDHLGSVREVVDAGTGGLEARFAYDPWGRRTQVAGTMDVAFGFTGHHYHEKSGFHLAPFREYSAELGRWMSRDPIEEKGGLNLYGYCFNNPLNRVDPTGECPICVAIVLGLLLVGCDTKPGSDTPKPEETKPPKLETDDPNFDKDDNPCTYTTEGGFQLTFPPARNGSCGEESSTSGGSPKDRLGILKSCCACKYVAGDYSDQTCEY